MLWEGREGPGAEAAGMQQAAGRLRDTPTLGHGRRPRGVGSAAHLT